MSRDNTSRKPAKSSSNNEPILSEFMKQKINDPSFRVRNIGESIPVDEIAKIIQEVKPDFWNDIGVDEEVMKAKGITHEDVKDYFRRTPQHILDATMQRGIKKAELEWEAKLKAMRENNNNTPK